MNNINAEMLFVVFQLQGNSYAIKSDHVAAITLFDEVTPVAGHGEDIRGLVLHRGQTIPLLDMRRKLKQIPLKEELARFEQMLHARKEDHLNWIDALTTTVRTGTDFRLATDPHQCAFGKWYDHFQTENHHLRFHLKKIDKPHRKLHHTAVLVLELMQKGDQAGAERLIEQAKRDYVSPLVKLLEQTTSIYTASVREIAIVVAYQDLTVGLIVDEVEGVEQLQILECDIPMKSYDYMIGIGKRYGSESLVILLNDELIIKAAN